MRNKKSFQCGGVLIELAIVVPLLMTLALVSFEFGKYMDSSEVLSVASRECANASFRECSFLTGANRNACLSEKVTRVQTSLPTNMRNGTNVIITIFTYNSTNFGIDFARFTSGGSSTSRFPMASWRNGQNQVIQEISPVNSDNRTVISCELFYRQPKMFKRTPLFSGSDRDVYEATVF